MLLHKTQTKLARARRRLFPVSEVARRRAAAVARDRARRPNSSPPTLCEPVIENDW